jgi:hypothetical protein
MLKFQNYYETEITWRLICWVLNREQNHSIDPSRALYLPNEKNLSFILTNWTWAKARIFDDIKEFSDRVLSALGNTMEKCVEVGDGFNL